MDLLLPARWGCGILLCSSLGCPRLLWRLFPPAGPRVCGCASFAGLQACALAWLRRNSSNQASACFSVFSPPPSRRDLAVAMPAIDAASYITGFRPSMTVDDLLVVIVGRQALTPLELLETSCMRSRSGIPRYQSPR